MKITEYRKFVTNKLRANDIGPIRNYLVRYSEINDVRAKLVYDEQNSNWKLIPSKINHNNKTFDLMAMLTKHEDIGPLLTFLIKTHSYDVIFQIPEMSRFPNIYAFLEENETAIKLVAEYNETNKIVAHTCFDISQFIIELTDIEDENHLLQVMEKLDSIGSGFDGVELVDYTNNKIVFIPSHSYILMDTIHSSRDIFGPQYFAFELIKRSEATIYNEIINDVIMKDATEYVLNTVLKEVFVIFQNGMNVSNTQIMNIALDKIAKMPDEIKQLFNDCLGQLSETRLSSSIIIWRQLLEKDIDYSSLFNAYSAIS